MTNKRVLEIPSNNTLIYRQILEFLLVGSKFTNQEKDVLAEYIKLNHDHNITPHLMLKPNLSGGDYKIIINFKESMIIQNNNENTKTKRPSIEEDPEVTSNVNLVEADSRQKKEDK